jgi:hypothetical protein
MKEDTIYTTGKKHYKQILYGYDNSYYGDDSHDINELYEKFVTIQKLNDDISINKKDSPRIEKTNRKLLLV